MSDQTPPMLEVVQGNPTAEELAALVVVISAKAAAADAGRHASRSGWASYWQAHRTPLTPGAGAWRASALPR